jgi:hypothetical protein
MKRPEFQTFSGEILKYALKKEPNIIVYHTFGLQIREEEDGELSQCDLIPFRFSLTKK